MAGRQLLLWWAVTSLVLELCAGGQLAGGVCGLSCCSGQPSCTEAQHVTCDCPQLDAIALGRGDIPPSVRSFSIRRVGAVVLHEGVFSGLSLLVIFNLSSVRNVTVAKGGMTLEAHPSAAFVHLGMRDIGTVQIQSLGVTGAWERVSFQLMDITMLHIETSAFNHTSESSAQEPLNHLMLQNIGMLILDSNAFETYVDLMHLDNVVMKVCQPQSFAGRIKTFLLDNVTISEAKGGCITGFDKQTTLSVRASNIDIMHPQAFSGNLQKLTIKNSTFVTMLEKALNLQLVGMKVSGLSVQRLSSEGLTVRADDSIVLEDVTVQSLRKRALVGLMTEPTATGFSPSLVIIGMAIAQAEPGSLAFSECADLQVSGLRVRSLSSRDCPTEKLTRELTDGAIRGPLTTAQNAIYWQLYEHRLCEQDDHLSSPSVVQKSRCERGTSEDVAPVRSGPVQDEESTSPEPGDDGQDPDPGHGTREERRSIADAAYGVSKPASSTPSAGIEVADKDVKIESQSEGNVVAEHLVGIKSQQTQLQEKEVQNPGPDVLTESDRNGTAARRPGGVGASGPAGVSLAEHQHRLVLYLSLGAVLALTVVLAMALVMVLRRRRRGRGSGTSDTSSVAEAPTEVETVLMVIVNRLLRQENERGAGGGRPSAPPDSGRSSMDTHQYEPIRPELLQSPPHYEPLIRFDQDSSDNNRANPRYCNLMDL